MPNLKKLESELKAGRISRREFMQAASLLGLAAVAPGVLNTAQAAPKKGGRLRVGSGHGSTTDSLDPATWENNYTQFQAYTIHNHLTEVLPSGALGPEVAESWEASADAKTWTFKLRQDVEFHNGKTLEASDVIASLNHHRGEDTKSGAKAVVGSVTDMKADGKNVVVVTLSEGNADFPFVLNDYHLAIVPGNADGKIDATAGIGCGAYSLKSFEPGVRSEFKKHANHYRDEYGHFDEGEMLSIGDVTARTNALITEEVDLIDRLDIKTLHLLKRNKNVKIMETSGTAHYSVPMRTDVPPFDNNDVRLALKYAVDRDALLQTVLRGHGAVGNDHPISTANRYHNPDIPQKTFDPDKVKFHLNKAGVKKLKVDLSAADAAFAGAVDAGVLYKEHAGKIGIEINVVREPNDGYWSSVWMNKPWSFCYWGGRPTEDWMFSTAYSSGAKWNDTFWEHEKFNQLLVAARSELDEAKRREMYGEMQRIVSDEGGVVIPMFNNYLFASNNRVGQPDVLATNWSLDGNRVMDRWWFES
jgi:peptide/nickel transport system substrate-binding protein